MMERTPWRIIQVYIAISFDCSALNWDCGLVNCGTNILHGCWLFWQNKIHDYRWTSFIIIAGNRNRGEGWHLTISFDCLALNWDCGLVNCGTNIICRYWRQNHDPSLMLSNWMTWQDINPPPVSVSCNNIERFPAINLNLVLSKESTPTKDVGTTVNKTTIPV